MLTLRIIKNRFRIVNPMYCFVIKSFFGGLLTNHQYFAEHAATGA